MRACDAVSARGTSVRGTTITPSSSPSTTSPGRTSCPPRTTGTFTAPAVAFTDPWALTASQARLDKEAASRAAFQQGELGLDRYGLRDKLPDFGIEYVSYSTWAEER